VAIAKGDYAVSHLIPKIWTVGILRTVVMGFDVSDGTS
jgi:hypothetical protein